MPYSASILWLDDWISADPPVLLDIYDLTDWIDNEMNEANKFFIDNAFKSTRAKNDAILILRAVYYEYFLFCQEVALKNLLAKPENVKRLKELPQSAQKSAQWHNETLELLTGHEFGNVVYGTANGKGLVAAKKCGTPVVVNEHEQAATSQTVYTFDAEGKLSAFKWGWRFEPVVRDLYERCFAEGEVFDGLGRIRHPFLPRLAASPDGIITSGPRCGRLVEIKSPITRELNGIIPPDYYCQMQLQAEVCDVNAVDYIEMRFTSMMLKDAKYSAAVSAKNPWMGKIMVVAKPPVKVAVERETGTVMEDKYDLESYEYRYSSLFPSSEAGFAECCAWFPNNIEGLVVLEETVWYVYDYFTKTVPRNRRWWAEVGQPAYEEFWVEVEAARKDGRYGEKAIFVSESDSDSDKEGVVVAAATADSGWLGVDSD
jgi:YqaJ-like viral recombinase domain